MRQNDLPRIQASLLHIPDGAYRIKSNTADTYLTCPRDAAIMVVVQQSDPSCDSQKVIHFLLQ